MKRKILFFSVFALFASATAAQTLQFAYDEAGNRISRTITILSPDLRAGEERQDVTSLVEQLATDLSVKIYPNPTKGLLQVELLGIGTDETVQLVLFGLNGQVLLQTDTTSKLVSVDMLEHSTGVYVLRLTVRGRSTDYKIIKQ
jgi:hypothetical protein